jgi:hypothetical protein
MFLLGMALSAQAATLVFADTTGHDRGDAAVQQALAACDAQAGVQRSYPSARYRRCMLGQGWRFSHLERDKPVPASSSIRYDGRVIVYDRDSRDPYVGWHWVNGMRTCTQDCENPEAPGSGYTCTYRTDGWRECVK